MRAFGRGGGAVARGGESAQGRWGLGQGRPGALPLDPDGVPPLSLALRGGSVLHGSRNTLDFARCLAANAGYGTDKVTT